MLSDSTRLMANNRIILTTVIGDLPLEDWARISRDIMAGIEAAPMPIHLIVDMLKMGTHPMNVVEIKKATIWGSDKRVLSINHLTTNRTVSLLGSVVIKMSLGQQYQVLTTLESAFDRIIHLDNSLGFSTEQLMAEAQSLS